MSSLPQRPLGRTGLATTIIGFGALEIGRDWGIGDARARQRPGEEDAGRTLGRVLDIGVNILDTASAYHRSEERIGIHVAARRREFILATKCGEHNREPSTYYDYSSGAITASITNSLRLLRTDVIDVLQIHFGPDPAMVLDSGACVRAMKEAREKGQVRFLGASIDGPLLDRCIASGDFDVVQVGYSLLRQDEGDRIAKAHDSGIGVLIRSGFGGGWLTSHATRVRPEERPPAVNALLDLCGGDGALLSKLALQFLTRHEGISAILVGSKSADHVEFAVRTLQEPVDESLLQNAVRVARESGSSGTR
jgi:aryl-alcohol dehydrogenase-like predicted oxidoreductase